MTHASALTMGFLLPCNKHPERHLETQLHTIHITSFQHLLKKYVKINKFIIFPACLRPLS